MSADPKVLSRFPMAQFVGFGAALHRAVQCDEQEGLEGDYGQAGGVIQRLEKIRDLLPDFELKDSYNLARLRLNLWIGRLKRAQSQGQTTLDGHAGGLQKVLEDINDSIFSEGANLYLFLARPFSSYDMEKFIETPRQMFNLPDYLDPSLPIEVERLVTQAGWCLAVGFGSSAVLFTLLTTESILRYFYEQLLEQPPRFNNGDIRPWKNMTKRLKNETKCPARLIEELNDLCVEYRNPAMHGRLDVDQDEVFAVWNRCSDAVCWMLDFLQEESLITGISDQLSA